MRRSAGALAIALSLAASQAFGAQSSVQLVIDLTADAERRVVKYECDTAYDLVTVEYINAHPNFLAITEVDGDQLIFVAAIAASGVRYVSGAYVWWTKGSEASLYDETNGPDAPPLTTCIEVNNTP